MRILALLIWPLRVLFRLLGRPLALWGRHKAAPQGGWLEVALEGPIVEQRLPSRIPQWLRARLGRKPDPQVSLTNVRRFVDEAIADPRPGGVLVQLGALQGGWASVALLREQLLRLPAAGKSLLVHLTNVADNRTYYVATAGASILGTPTGVIAPTGTAASTLFLRDALDRAGVTVEVDSAGRYKSAPDAFTRVDRSEFDLEQTRALVDQVDAALVESITESRAKTEDQAQAIVDQAPMVGAHAQQAGLLDGLARDEDLLEHVQTMAGTDEPPKLVGAGSYLAARTLRPIIPSRRKQVGIVEVHGAIVEQSSPYAQGLDQVALQSSVVGKLRSALSNKRIGAVVLHVNSRGGGVAASDAIYSAVRRLDQDKPVIACFSDVAASGGYYVACGARGIVGSPLTITGSIGVFSMRPVAAQLAARLDLHQDVVSNRANADLYNLWRARTDEERTHARREIKLMYDTFIALVAEARGMSVAAVDTVAEGRVWTGHDAHERGLLDSLGGLTDAIDRAKDAAGGRFEDRAVIVRGPRNLPKRPAPHAPAALIRTLGVPPMLLEMLALSSAAPRALGVAYAPIELS